MDKEKHRIAAIDARQAQQPQASYAAEESAHSLLDGLLVANRNRRPVRKSLEARASASVDDPSAASNVAEEATHRRLPENFGKESTGAPVEKGSAHAHEAAFSKERVPDAVRQYYQELLSAPVPDSIMSLVKKLREKEKAQGQDTDPEGSDRQ